jgi:TetR/AcrR family transcriptional regulator
MTQRLPSAQRRQQIVAAALDLLAQTPVEVLTTRDIARAVGISQPALFRHFRSRAQILDAVVEQSRQQLLPIAAGALELDGLAGLRHLALGLVEHADQNPGLPRLLFHSLASEVEPEAAAIAVTGTESKTRPPHFRTSLRLLISMQQNLVAELIHQAQRQAEIPTGISVTLAAELYINLLQGRLLQSKFTESGGTHPDTLVEFWLAGLPALHTQILDSEVGHAGCATEPCPSQSETADPLPTLDVTPILATGVDPLEKIQAVLQQMPPYGVLQLTAPFKPVPLLGLLDSRGFRCTAQAIADDRWQMEIGGPQVPPVLDLLQLEVPEPMIQILTATADLAPGACVLARVPRVPSLLIPRLVDRGLQVHYQEGEAPGVLLLALNPESQPLSTEQTTS